MIRRALLATSLVAFAHTGAALLFAGPLLPRPKPAPIFQKPRHLNPLGVALSADGRLAYVALSGIDAVAEVDLATGQTLRRIPAGSKPREVRRDGSILTVIDDGPGVLLISLESGGARRVEQAPTEPLLDGQLVIPATPKGDEMDGLHLTVAQEPAWDSNRPGVTEAVFENVLQASLRSKAGASVLGFSGALGFAGGTTQTGLGFVGAGFNGNFLAAPLDGPRGVGAQPTAAVWNRPFNMIFVAAAGSDTVLALSPEGLRTNLKTAVRKAAERPFTQPPAWWGGGSGASTEAQVARPPVRMIRHRLPTQSNPRRLALSDDGRLLVVSNTLSDSLTVIAVGPLGARVVGHVPLGGPHPDAARRGEVLFHSARLSFNGRFACSSCHPDGGSDGHVWLTPTEDAGFARRTKSLFGVRDTVPYGWRGDSPTLADRVKKTLSQLHKHTPKRDEVRDLVAYLESLDPPAPVPVADDARDAVERGRALFEDRGKCTKCHSDDRMTDGKRHDVGTGGWFDTPSLRGVGSRMNLLHTGKAADPLDIFRFFNLEQKHGAAHEFDRPELDDLVAFLRTL